MKHPFSKENRLQSDFAALQAVIYSINIASPKEKNRYFSCTAVL